MFSANRCTATTQPPKPSAATCPPNDVHARNDTGRTPEKEEKARKTAENY